MILVYIHLSYLSCCWILEYLFFSDKKDNLKKKKKVKNVSQKRPNTDEDTTNERSSTNFVAADSLTELKANKKKLSK